MKYQVAVAGRTFEIEVDTDRLVRVNGHPYYVDLEQVGDLPVYSLGLGDSCFVVFVERGQESYEVEVQGQRYPVRVRVDRTQLGTRPTTRQDDGESLAICAPLAGRLVALPVMAGDWVEARQVVAVVESMKMQMEITTCQAAEVESVHGPPDRDVSQGEVLVRLRPS
jgi:biotin carboxyl carrier protein